MRCKVCRSKILRKGNQIPLRKLRRRPFDSCSGIARACPKCGLLHWNNGPAVKKLIIEGKECDGPVYLVAGRVTLEAPKH